MTPFHIFPFALRADKLSAPAREADIKKQDSEGERREKSRASIHSVERTQR